MICLIASGCLEFTPNAMQFLGCLFVVGSVFELLTFSFFASSVCDEFQSCSFSVGSGFAIISVTLSFATALLVFMIPPAKEDAPPIVALPGPGTKTVTETVTPDDTKTITETTVNADGSQTVTETVVQPEKV
jgi:hypothetical protein